MPMLGDHVPNRGIFIFQQCSRETKRKKVERRNRVRHFFCIRWVTISIAYGISAMRTSSAAMPWLIT